MVAAMALLLPASATLPSPIRALQYSLPHNAQAHTGVNSRRRHFLQGIAAITVSTLPGQSTAAEPQTPAELEAAKRKVEEAQLERITAEKELELAKLSLEKKKRELAQEALLQQFLEGGKELDQETYQARIKTRSKNSSDNVVTAGLGILVGCGLIAAAVDGRLISSADKALSSVNLDPAPMIPKLNLRMPDLNFNPTAAISKLGIPIPDQSFDPRVPMSKPGIGTPGHNFDPTAATPTPSISSPNENNSNPRGPPNPARAMRVEADTWGRAAAVMEVVVTAVSASISLQDDCMAGDDEACLLVGVEEDAKRAWLGMVDARTWGAIAAAVREVASLVQAPASPALEAAQRAWLAQLDESTWSSAALTLSTLAEAELVIADLGARSRAGDRQVGVVLESVEDAHRSWLSKLELPTWGRATDAVAAVATAVAGQPAMPADQIVWRDWPGQMAPQQSTKQAWLARLEAPTVRDAGSISPDMAQEFETTTRMQLESAKCDAGDRRACDSLTAEEAAKQAWLATLQSPEWMEANEPQYGGPRFDRGYAAPTSWDDGSFRTR